MELEPLADKWRAFGWKVLEIDGHDIPSILKALDASSHIKGMPTVVIAKTTKGKGVSFMEDNPAFHGKAPSKEQLTQALLEIG